MSHSTAGSAGTNSGSNNPRKSDQHPIAAEFRKWQTLLSDATPPMTDDLFDRTVDEATQKQREQAYLDATEAATKDLNRDFMKWCADHEEELAAWSDTCAYRGDEIDLMEP
ncbi:hypothetical protein ARMSODRAFT_959311 [Armillaria solidipes]|uniref:Uncharacterized protein n=1 Tax=Armillaria solidipes TaxID=1076256 RepID=A0A2H3BRH0_9AGAR|nr:hypothetical protein ARMSODRAFT_959311 [Armillaria solidipes]